MSPDTRIDNRLNIVCLNATAWACPGNRGDIDILTRRQPPRERCRHTTFTAGGRYRRRRRRRDWSGCGFGRASGSVRNLAWPAPYRHGCADINGFPGRDQQFADPARRWRFHFAADFVGFHNEQQLPDLDLVAGGDMPFG